MPTSVRLDAETEALLDRLVRTYEKSRSEILRDAIRRLAEEAARPVGEHEGPFALVADLIGIADGGPPDLARRHKEAYRERLRKSRRR
jgi:Arc/MetJ-type ribon-helix-helix transcriptional regulator